MNKIVLITTGGTIASRLDPNTKQTIPTANGDYLCSLLPDDARTVNIEVDEFSNISSFGFDLVHAFRLAERINHHHERPDCSGVVVTHGTDTMEESAYLADLLLKSEKPVVFTGAQKSADAPDADGPRNLLDSLRLAADHHAHGIGSVILFEQDFHSARDVTKTHTSRVDTFASGEHGKLGEVDGEKVVLFRRPVLRKTFSPTGIVDKVDLIKLVIGADARFLHFAVNTGARAIVLEAFGRGNATPQVAEAVSEIVAAGTPVIVTSRCPQGRVKPIYGRGGGSDLERAGAVFAGDLTGPKARILVAVLLGLGLSGTALRNEIEALAG